ncbi:MAG: DUF1592 domain-containing protein [Pirellula sp.]
MAAHPWIASLCVCIASSTTLVADDRDPIARDAQERALADEYHSVIAPMVEAYCIKCHNEVDRESGIRVDQLDASFSDAAMGLWEGIRKQIESGDMPPEDEPQPTDAQRQAWIQWIDRGLHFGRSREVPRNGAMRRLTVAQYQTTLNQLLGIDESWTDLLPPDAVSKDGFTNNAATLQLSPLQLEAYLEIAQQALELATVAPEQPPTIEHFKMELGKGINREPCPDTLILGAFNRLLPNSDFVVTEPDLQKTFAFRPFRMQRQFRFIEGYQGNDTVRAWKDFDSIYHAVFACLRGSEGYPKGRAYEVASDGLLLRPAIPSPEIFGESNTYGPHANFKIALRDLPESGRFRVTVQAAKLPDGWLLDAKSPGPDATDARVHRLAPEPGATVDCHLPADGIYRIDLHLNPTGEAEPLPPPPIAFPTDTPPPDKRPQIDLHWSDAKGDSLHLPAAWTQPHFVVARLPKGVLRLTIKVDGGRTLEGLDIVRIQETSPLGQQFLTFEKRSPQLGVHVGLRRDCGSTLSPVGTPQPVSNTELREYVFEGSIRRFPSPDVEKDNVNYLAGIREIAIRSEYTDGRDVPRLKIHSVAFEGPLHDQWPPASHRNIFPASPHQNDPERYAREILASFGPRAFRRPLSDAELDRWWRLWQSRFRESQSFRQSILETLQAMLASPQFLYLIESSEGPQAEPIDEWELASKLSYFLWNGPPDEELIRLAGEGRLREELDRQVDRMIDDDRFAAFADQFASQWLGLDKFATVEIDAKRYPNLNRLAKQQLREEPARFLEHALRNNLQCSNLIASEFILANEITASYYGLGTAAESGFEFRPIPHASPWLGGVVTQAAVLAGLSDGREANPVKRGAWFARRIIAEPPADPPPNVPKLEDLTQLSLRERLERHRNVRGCIQCHTGIDPWGLPFEAFNAAGLPITEAVNASSDLPDGSHVDSFEAFRKHLLEGRQDAIAFSWLKHTLAYACGRSLTYNEVEMLRTTSREFIAEGRGLKDAVHWIVHSPAFQSK